MARLKLPGRSLEAPGNRGPRGMIITGAHPAQNSAYGLLRGFLWDHWPLRWRWVFFISPVFIPYFFKGGVRGDFFKRVKIPLNPPFSKGDFVPEI